MTSVRDTCRTELRRVFTVRSSYVLLAAAVLGTAVIGLFVALVRDPGRMNGPVSSAALTGGGASVPLSAAGLLLAALASIQVGHDHRYGMLALSLTAQPRRGVLLIARLTVFGLVAAVTAALASTLAGAVCLAVGRPPALDVVTLRTVGLALAVAVAWAWLGAGLTTLWRNGAATVSVLLLLPLVVEPALSWAAQLSARPEWVSAVRWLPFTAAREMLRRQVRPTAEGIGVLAGCGVVAATTLVVVALGWLALRRRDA